MKKAANFDKSVESNTNPQPNFTPRRAVFISPRYRAGPLAPLPRFDPSAWNLIDADEASDEDWDDASHRSTTDVLAEEFDEPAPGYGHADLHREWTMARHCRIDEDADY